MDYRVVYTQKALSDLANIIGHIADGDAGAALRFANSLLDHVELLARFPQMGGPVRKRANVRKLVHSPLVVYYQLRDSKRLVELLHIRHAARKPPGREL